MPQQTVPILPSSALISKEDDEKFVGKRGRRRGQRTLQPRLRPREGLAAGVVKHGGHEEAGHSQTTAARRPDASGQISWAGLAHGADIVYVSLQSNCWGVVGRIHAQLGVTNIAGQCASRCGMFSHTAQDWSIPRLRRVLPASPANDHFYILCKFAMREDLVNDEHRQ